MPAYIPEIFCWLSSSSELTELFISLGGVTFVTIMLYHVGKEYFVPKKSDNNDQQLTVTLPVTCFAQREAIP